LKTKSFWQSGASATLRGVGDKVYWAFPTIVIQDSPELIVLYMHAGVQGKNVDHKPAASELFSANKLNVIDFQWQRTDVLMLIVPSEAFSTYIMWETGTKNLDCWYVNLQEPIRRTSIGFDTMDNMLDVVISPDMDTWRWKDDDEFSEAQKIGFYSPEKARDIWSEGERAVQLITKERRDLYKKWEKWQANPEWELPILSPDWQTVKLQ
jgi:protein associated with RNAse G/E